MTHDAIFSVFYNVYLCLPQVARVLRPITSLVCYLSSPAAKFELFPRRCVYLAHCYQQVQQ